uniref:Biogenesis of lysosomal organelles complex-1, subunit 6, pallidin n=1 Tax=Seriola lalandi dorsalis TaxID=1841481 RepID=A0A3B4XJK5_SERLL
WTELRQSSPTSLRTPPPSLSFTMSLIHLIFVFTLVLFFFVSTRQNQLILLDTLDQEVTKFRECNALLDLNSLFTEAKVYHNKLVNIRKEMIMLHEKTTKLKKRSLKLQQQKQKEALEKEQQREKELERERQLIAKPAKRT